MSIISIVFWAVVLWFLYKAIRFVWRGVSQYKQQRTLWEQFYRQATGQEPPHAGQSHRSKQEQQPHPRTRRKIFTKDDGEYVEFEDIIVTETKTSTSSTSDGKKRTHTSTTTTESQIVDAEWEDIP